VGIAVSELGSSSARHPAGPVALLDGEPVDGEPVDGEPVDEEMA
jgi:hypothetical protein